MIDHLRIFKHDNGPCIFELDGFLTKNTLPTLVVNLHGIGKFILDFKKISGIDTVSADTLSEISKNTEMIIWNADRSTIDMLKRRNIEATFRPEIKKRGSSEQHS